MGIRMTVATTKRILTQLLHDKRTLTIVLVVPVVVLTLLHYLFDAREPLVSRVELIMLVVFPLILMFLLTSIAMVRERISGTLERLLTTPISKGSILFGYAFAFGVLASVQVVVATFFTLWVLDMQRSEEHTSELQSRGHLVCRLLLEKKKIREKNDCYSTRE